ncbi:DNA cytosine methyltransferase [Desulfotomaculum nigrificans]|uniref:DNA cytosine methyltransferase n=1 Tax=Desulfotomaculum nigrificans TaxID=1565 RepID=UPI0001FAEB2B|nr:DNA cytosine methyltransferase [Desulfotomaculum nigrificans]
MAVCKSTFVKPKIIHDRNKNIQYYFPGAPSVNTCTDLPVISLFTGGGGLDLGLEQAGFTTAAFVENDKYCIETIKANRNWPLVGNGDVTEITSYDILKEANLSKGDVALLAGGAPCQPFSNLGKNEGDKTLNGQLYKHFIRLVKEIQPAAFLFENVKGMLQNHKKVIQFMKEEFGKIGYGIAVSLLCAADYGVPQKRYRIFIIGRRDGKLPGFPFPTHANNPELSLKYFNTLCKSQDAFFPYTELKKWVTVKEAFSKLTDKDYSKEYNYYANLSPRIIEMIKHIKPGTKMCWADLPEHLKFDCWKKGNFQGNDNFSRLQYDEPAVTIRTGAVYPAKGKYIHPKLDRGLSTLEMAVLQSFPISGDNGWIFKGGITSVARQIGNAVPPLLAKAIGESLKLQISEVINGEQR